MKKKIYIVICLLFLLLTGCSSKINEDNQNKESYNFKKALLDEGYKKIEFVCDDIKGKVIDSNYNRILTNDGEIYFLSLEKKYSDDTNCKKVETDIKFKSLIGNELAITEDNKFYMVTYFNGNMKLEEYDWNKNQDTSNTPSAYEYIYNTYGDDVIIYNSQNDEYILYKNNTVFYKLIRKAYHYEKKEYYFVDITKQEFEVKDEIVSINKSFNGFFESEKAFYKYDEVNKDKCNKYADIQCEYGIVKDELLSKYKSFVQTAIDGRILDKNNNLYSKTGW